MVGTTLLLRVILLLLLCIASAEAAYVQGGENSDSASAATVTLTGATSGNYLVVFGVAEASAGSITFSTTAGTTSAWTQEIDQVESGDFAIIGAAWATVSTTGDTTVEAAYGGSAFIGLIVLEIDNIDSFDAAQYARDTTGVRTTALTTPAAYPAMTVGFAYDWGLNGIPAATTGWTARVGGMPYPDGAGTDGGASETRLYASGDVQASFDDSAGPDPFFTVAMIFTETDGGGGQSPVPIILQQH